MPDLILLHPPSVYDFRKKFIMYGPVADAIPSTPVFELYPIGFISLLAYLQQRGYDVRIVNIASMMLNDPKFDPERFISKLNSQVFGIDLHWAVHAQGAIELARIVKKHHPNAFIVLGGLTSTYFHYQIMKDYPFVDYIIRGDSAEEPLFQLLNRIEEKRVLEKVPNLTWRDATGKIHANPITMYHRA